MTQQLHVAGLPQAIEDGYFDTTNANKSSVRVHGGQSSEFPIYPTHRGIRHRVLTNQQDRSYVYAVVSLAAGGPFVGGPIVTYIFSRVIVSSVCVRVWKKDCDVRSLVEHRVKSLQQNGP